MVIFILISSEIENADDELWIIKLTSNYPVWSSAYFRLNFYWLDYGYQYSGLWKNGLDLPAVLLLLFKKNFSRTML